MGTPISKRYSGKRYSLLTVWRARVGFAKHLFVAILFAALFVSFIQKDPNWDNAVYSLTTSAPEWHDQEPSG